MKSNEYWNVTRLYKDSVKQLTVNHKLTQNLCELVFMVPATIKYRRRVSLLWVGMLMTLVGTVF